MVELCDVFDLYRDLTGGVAQSLDMAARRNHWKTAIGPKIPFFLWLSGFASAETIPGCVQPTILRKASH